MYQWRHEWVNEWRKEGMTRRRKIDWLREWTDFVSGLVSQRWTQGFLFQESPGERCVPRRADSSQDTRGRFTAVHACGGNRWCSEKRGENPLACGWELVVLIGRSVRDNRQNPVYKSQCLGGDFFPKTVHPVDFLTLSSAHPPPSVNSVRPVLPPALKMVGVPGCAAGFLLPVLLLQVPAWCSAGPCSPSSFLLFGLFSMGLLWG